MRPDSGPVRLLFVGQIREMKNQIFLLEVSRFLPDGFRLDLVGGKSWDRRYYRKFVKAIRSERYPKVEWHGELGRRETAEFFRRADLFLNPSLIEVQNLSQIEAFVAGLPTVRLHGPLTRGVTVHLQTAVHLDEETSPKEFAEAVVRLARDRRLYDEIRGNAVAEGSRYSWRTTAERILDFFARRAGALDRKIDPRPN
jgi:glycosyltransferase involved in cell wall biosynthesis